MSKTIWIINQYAGSPEYGMNFRSYYIGKELVKKGYKVTIFTSSYTHQRIKLPKIKKTFTQEYIDGIRYIWVKTPKYKNSKSLGRFWSMIIFMIKLFFYKDSSKQKPDVVIASSLSIFSTLNGWIWSKKYKSEFLFEVRDLWPQTLIEIGNVSKYHPLVLFMRIFEDIGYKKAKYVISLLPKAKEHMINKGMKENKYIYIPNGVCLDEIKLINSLPNSIKEKIPKDKFIIGYTGTIGIANALDYLCEAAKLLENKKDIAFVIVGNGKEKEKLMKKYKSANLIFIDSVPKEYIQAILKEFDVCYIGLKKEKIFKYGVSPNKLFDYMLASKPILYAIESGNNIVKEVNCGISVKAEDAKEIVNGVLKLYEMDCSYLNKLGRNGKEYIIKNQTYKILTKKFESLLD